jgi:hypothetical protein
LGVCFGNYSRGDCDHQLFVAQSDNLGSAQKQY